MRVLKLHPCVQARGPRGSSTGEASVTQGACSSGSSVSWPLTPTEPGTGEGGPGNGVGVEGTGLGVRLWTGS